jgi:hypothetical protein
MSRRSGRPNPRRRRKASAAREEGCNLNGTIIAGMTGRPTADESVPSMALALALFRTGTPLIDRASTDCSATVRKSSIGVWLQLLKLAHCLLCQTRIYQRCAACATMRPLRPGTSGRGGSRGGVGGGKGEESDAAGGGNDIEFDDRGRAVPARSADGIRIKYECRRRTAGEGIAPLSSTEPVLPLAGIASTVFDDHMTPYVALEERSMGNQLRAAASDNTVDASAARRRCRPVAVRCAWSGRARGLREVRPRWAHLPSCQWGGRASHSPRRGGYRLQRN